MKNIFYIFALLLLSISGYSQKASDYYLPLCTGNFLYSNCPEGPGGWDARTFLVRIVRAEPINGQTFYYQRGVETMSPTDSNYYQGFWLNTDANGNIMMGAYDTSESGTLANAVILPSPAPFFPNEFLTLGYARTYLMGGPGMSGTDSTISTTASVGSYTNCLVVRSFRKNNSVIVWSEDTYYAPNIGIVKIERTLPVSEIHTTTLVNYLARKCSGSGVNERTAHKMHMRVYPNPSNGLVNIEWGNPEGESVFMLFDIWGRQVLEKTISEANNSFHIEGLQKGLYQYLILNEAGSKMSGNLLIE